MKLWDDNDGIDAPPKTSIEISVFGVGESIAVHSGNGRWTIIDSFLPSGSKKPIALHYFEKIGIDPSVSIETIIATHWHDDHIEGISQIYDLADSSPFWCTGATTLDNFKLIAGVFLQKTKIAETVGTGSDDFIHILSDARNRGKGRQRVKYAKECVVVLRNGSVEVMALSPSDSSITRATASLAKLIPAVRKQKCRLPNVDDNESSVVLSFKIGDFLALFGADLQENPSGNWVNILATHCLPNQKHRFFKIPHHGSNNGHNADVWGQLLIDDAVAEVTTFTRSKIPKDSDITRIRGMTNNGYATAKLDDVVKPAKRTNKQTKK